MDCNSATVKTITQRLVGEGAQAVVITGSRVRGDAHRESDVDFMAIGEGPHYRLERLDSYLISLSWRTVEEQCSAFNTPSIAGGVIPGWRSARILHDPGGIAASLQAYARAWTWEAIAAASDVWVAAYLTDYAEEVHKLIAALEMERLFAAAVQRDLLAVRLAPALAVHLRLLYDTENMLWDLVAEQMGSEWEQAQRAAFALNGERFEDSCSGALRLYIIAMRQIDALLDPRQREVSAYACTLAENRLKST